ncbi:type II toxin-antitoxin system VapC family toxin [soil metagenome]
MVIDSSVMVAIVLGEPEATALTLALRADEIRLLGTPTRTEMTVVLAGREGDRAVRALKRLLDGAEVTDVPFDRELADLATDGYSRYGKGNHPARLNLGDCFTYAVAKRAGEPVLCVGDEFARTDIDVVALDPPS